jgi:hypothetical protein
MDNNIAITDDYILKLLIKENGNLNTCRIKIPWLKKHGIYDYLINRFPGISDIQKIVYWINNKMKSNPICSICGKENIRFKSFSAGYYSTCSQKCTKELDIETSQLKNLTDEDILKIAYDKYGRISPEHVKERWLKLHGYYDYIMSRYDDSESICETFYRIIHKIEIRPTCKECGNAVNFIGKDIGYRQFCCNDCANKNEGTNIKKKDKGIKSLIESYKKRFNLDIEVPSGELREKVFVLNYCPNHPRIELTWLQLGNRLKQHRNLCINCSPERNSETSIETRIKNILDEFGINYIQHNRNILKPRELDFYFEIDNIKYGIECNGVYWHQGLHGKALHLEKRKLAEKNNIRLLSLWEDDIKYSLEKIRWFLQTKCQKNKKIYARLCQIKEVSSKESKEFLNNYHLQNNCNAPIRLGLYYKDELVQLMTFGKLRKNLGSKSKEGVFELYRLCSKGGYSIIGGPSKILSYFKKHYSWNSLITYCHCDISNGDIYEKLGFSFVKDCGQGYTYAHYKTDYKRINRFNLRKSIIDDGSGRTANEILEDQKYFKCYDSGVKKYELKNN